MNATEQLRRAADLEPTRTEECIICKRSGHLTADGWYTEYRVAPDEDGAFVAGDGDDLADAEDVADGWVCSKRCRSQAMYRHSDKVEKEALRKVRDACQVIVDYGRDAVRVVEAGMQDYPVPDLVEAAADFLNVIADDRNGSPEWCNRETPDAVISHAQFRIEWLARVMGVETGVMISHELPPIVIEWMAEHAATAAHIADYLKNADEAGDE